MPARRPQPPGRTHPSPGGGRLYGSPLPFAGAALRQERAGAEEVEAALGGLEERDVNEIHRLFSDLTQERQEGIPLTEGELLRMRIVFWGAVHVIKSASLLEYRRSAAKLLEQTVLAIPDADHDSATSVLQDLANDSDPEVGENARAALAQITPPPRGGLEETVTVKGDDVGQLADALTGVLRELFGRPGFPPKVTLRFSGLGGTAELDIDREDDWSLGGEMSFDELVAKLASTNLSSGELRVTWRPGSTLVTVARLSLVTTTAGRGVPPTPAGAEETAAGRLLREMTEGPGRVGTIREVMSGVQTSRRPLYLAIAESVASKELLSEIEKELDQLLGSRGPTVATVRPNLADLLESGGHVVWRIVGAVPSGVMSGRWIIVPDLVDLTQPLSARKFACLILDGISRYKPTSLFVTMFANGYADLEDGTEQELLDLQTLLFG